MGKLPQAVEIIFEVQRKRINEKTTREKKRLFNSQNVFIYLFFLFRPLLFSNLKIFLFLVHLKQFKVL
jgi:hypothetical protein